MEARDLRIPTLLVLAAFAIGFSLGVICQGRASDAGATAPGPVFDPRIKGGTVLQQAAADWVLIIRPDLSETVVSVEFVPKAQLLVNARPANQQVKDRCWKDDEGRPLAEGRCVGEALGKGNVRIAREYQPQNIDHLLHVLAHEYAHTRLYANCGLCTLDEHLADLCADDPSACRRTR
jgi:hypothetical protein